MKHCGAFRASPSRDAPGVCASAPIQADITTALGAADKAMSTTASAVAHLYAVNDRMIDRCVSDFLLMGKPGIA